jgi:hypothetical protein
MNTIYTPFSFGDGYVSNKNKARVTAQVDELVEAGSSESRLMTWTRENSRWTYFGLEWNVIKITEISVPDFHVVAMGQDGTALVSMPAQPVEETIDSTENGPAGRGPLLDLRCIGDHAYAVGMSRQVYRREYDGDWTRQDSGLVQSVGDLDVVGFYSIDGTSEEDLYAVGFAGEIWHRKKGEWYKIDSPTSVVLHKVRVTSKDIIYACGQKGILLRGSDQKWEIISQDLTEDDFWSIEWFHGNLYAATESSIFMLDDDDVLQTVDLGLGNERTYMYLHANDGVMWSFGTKHLAWTEDAKSWKDATP